MSCFAIFPSTTFSQKSRSSDPAGAPSPDVATVSPLGLKATCAGAMVAGAIRWRLSFSVRSFFGGAEAPSPQWVPLPAEITAFMALNIH